MPFVSFLFLFALYAVTHKRVNIAGFAQVPGGRGRGRGRGGYRGGFRGRGRGGFRGGRGGYHPYY